MIIQFNTGDVTFFEEDQQYFEKRLGGILKYFGGTDENDEIKIMVKLSKDKHHSGERFHASLNMTAPHGANFRTEADNENIKGLADKLNKTLQTQIVKFKETH